LSDRVITAPFGGVLGFRQVSQGTLVTPGTAITTLDDVSILKLDFSIPEIFLGSIGVDAKVIARSSAFADEEFIGTVRSVGSRVDPLTRAVTVRAHIDNADGRLKPGMLLTVRLATPPRDTLAVDEISVVQTGTMAFVYRVDPEGKAQRVDVQIGARQSGRVEILSGLSAGDRVVAEGLVKLRPGMQVSET
jgi:membrane fusion protein (multidrug efflux system)